MSVDVRSFPQVVDVERAGADPPYDHPDYVGTRLRAPKEPLVIIPSTLSELTGMSFVIYPTPGFYLANSAPKFPEPPSNNPTPLPPWWTPRLIERAKDVFDYPDFIQRKRVQRRLAEVTRSEPGWAFPSLPADRLALFESDLGTLTDLIQATGARAVLLTHATRFGSSRAADDEETLMAWRQFTPKASGEILLEFEARAADATHRVADRKHAAPGRCSSGHERPTGVVRGGRRASFQ